jgi:membrane associated rhomboid family serine protease
MAIFSAFLRTESVLINRVAHFFGAIGGYLLFLIKA